jgi:steroid delta-isomerase-like uncharacterized protein
MTMDRDDKKAVCNKIAAAMSAQDFPTLQALMAPEMGAEFVAGFRQLLTAFPDYHGTNVEQVCEGDKVANRWIFYGTHQGPFMGIPATGKHVTFRGMSLDHIVDGKLVAAEIVMDMLDVLKQLGVNPIPTQPEDG